MSIKTKQRLVTLLRAFNYVGLIVLLFVTFSILGQIRKQAITNHDDTAKAVQQIEKDHDVQNRYLQCLVNLFLHTESDVVTPDQSAKCLAATRATTTNTTTIQPSESNGGTTTTTTTTQPKGQPINSQTRPNTTSSSPNTTTSAPPDPTTSTPSPTPQPSLVEQVTDPITNTVTKLVGGLW